MSPRRGGHIADLDVVHAFWQEERPEGNYFAAVGPNARSATILTVLAPFIDESASILEVGCNVGRNLNHLYQCGFKGVAGVEISGPAVERLRSSYEELKDVPIYVGPAEEELSKLPTNGFDVVFTMAVLEHIHPSSRQVMDEIARVASRYVLAIEPTPQHAHDTSRQYPWDIPAEFARVGLKPKTRIPWRAAWTMPKNADNYWQPGFDHYWAYLFEVPGTRPTSRSSVSSTLRRLKRRVPVLKSVPLRPRR